MKEVFISNKRFKRFFVKCMISKIRYREETIICQKLKSNCDISIFLFINNFISKGHFFVKFFICWVYSIKTSLILGCWSWICLNFLSFKLFFQNDWSDECMMYNFCESLNLMFLLKVSWRGGLINKSSFIKKCNQNFFIF